MGAASSGCVSDLPKEFYHDPTLHDSEYWTVAMYVATFDRIKQLPREFYHDATLKDKRDRTVAMLAAKNKNIKRLPRQFYHDPTLKDNYGWTVRDILINFGFPVYNEWIIRDLSFVETKEEKTCCVCFEEDVKLQLKMKCSDGHVVC